MGQQVSKQYKKLPFAYIQKSDDLQDSPLSTSSVFSAPHSTVDNASTSVLNFDDEDFLENKGQITFQMLINTNSIGLCSQKIIGINRNIGLLQQTERLQLCCNVLSQIPPEIGYLKNLTSLSLGKNRLTEIPETIGLLSKLVELKLNDNLLITLPRSIGLLSKLTSLSIENNRISKLPYELGTCSSVTTIDASDNPLDSIPSELSRLKFLRTISLENCPLLTTFVNPTTNQIPTLKELCAREIVRSQIPILTTTSNTLIEYLATASRCTCCSGPYFETYIRRIRFVEHHEDMIPYEYRLCVSHWISESERIRCLFASPPDTSPVHIIKLKKWRSRSSSANSSNSTLYVHSRSSSVSVCVVDSNVVSDGIVEIPGSLMSVSGITEGVPLLPSLIEDGKKSGFRIDVLNKDFRRSVRY